MRFTVDMSAEQVQRLVGFSVLRELLLLKLRSPEAACQVRSLLPCHRRQEAQRLAAFFHGQTEDVLDAFFFEALGR